MTTTMMVVMGWIAVNSLRAEKADRNIVSR